MPEAEVLHSDIKFKRGRGNKDAATPSTAEPTLSEVKISEAQRPAEHGSKQPAASKRRSGVTWERVALLLLSVLLVAALGVTLYETTQSLQKLLEESEAKHLSENLSGTEPCKVEHPKETCPRSEDGWEPHGGKCYFFSSVNLTWTQSRTQCISMRGDLVVINSTEEQEFLHSRLSVEKIDKPEDKFWIGLRDSEKEDKWLWVDDTRLDPSLKIWSKNCVMMGKEKGDKYLFAKSCESSQKYICEKPEEAGA